jgi:NitT/TauT family transport system substrate-binding protein
MGRIRRRMVIFICVLVVAGLTGCGDDKSSSGSSGLEKDTLTVASLPLLDSAGLHIAVDKGFFKAEGLTVKIEPVAQSIAALPALKKGQLDVIAGANYVTFLQANEQGTIHLRIVADGAAVAAHFMQLLVPADSPITKPAELAGKTVAVNILNNIQSLDLNTILRTAGVDPATIKYRAVPFPLMDKALANHDVDAVHTAEPFGTVIAQKTGARMLLDGGSGKAVLGLPVSGYVTTQEFVTKYPKTAAAFRRAIAKAQALATQDRSEVERVLPAYAKVDAKTATELALPGFPTALEPARLQRLTDLMRQEGLLKKPLDPASVIFTPPGQ